MTTLTPLVLLTLTLSACDRPKKKLVGDCLMSAVAFYAKGGTVFDEKGCSVDTDSYRGTCDFSGGPTYSQYSQGPQSHRCVAITARDVHDGRERSLSARLPAEWLVPEKLPDLAEEFNSFVDVCLAPAPKEETAKNPLLKSGQTVESPCNFVSLKVNDVPGFGVYSAAHVHFSLRSMETKEK
jgi:hypothetical protein